MFLYRHQSSLIGAEYLARLSGYPAERIVALDALESLGLVGRSGISQGTGLYQFTTPAEPPRQDTSGPFLVLAEHRPGRLLLSSDLLRGDRTLEEGLRAARCTLE